MIKIAIPLVNNELSMHFGHCEQFAIIDADEEKKTIIKSELATPPPHEPGVLPRWLASQGVQMIIAGGMGSRAQDLFAAQQIKVLTGAPVAAPEQLVAAYFAGNLELGANACDH
jgi:ATP-binding protein involved in chromosome partitioning